MVQNGNQTSKTNISNSILETPHPGSLAHLGSVSHCALQMSLRHAHFHLRDPWNSFCFLHHHNAKIVAGVRSRRHPLVSRLCPSLCQGPTTAGWQTEPKTFEKCRWPSGLVCLLSHPELISQSSFTLPACQEAALERESQRQRPTAHLSAVSASL